MGRNYGDGFYGAGFYEGSGLAQFIRRITETNVLPLLLIDIEFPGGTRYYSATSARFQDVHYKGRVISCGTFRRAIQQNLGLFETSSVEVVLADTDQELINLTEDDSETIKGSKVTFRLGAQSLPFESFQIIFEGYIDDYGADNFTFRISVKDKLWFTPDLPVTRKVNTDDFPDALPADVGRPLLVCYGEHSFVNADDPNTVDYKMRGAWPTLFVNADTRIFLVACHAVKSIDEVYAFTNASGSQLLTLTTDYTKTVAGTLAGQTMAYITLTPTGFAKLVDGNTLGVLTCNVKGKETVGDGSGTLITNPVTIMQDFLENYCGDPEINEDTFDLARATADDRAYVAIGGYVEEKATEEVLKDICDSFQIRIFPDRNGRVAVSIFKPVSIDDVVYSIREQWEILKGSWALNYSSDFQGAEDAQIINDIDYKFKLHFAKNVFLGGGAIADADSQAKYDEKNLTLSLPWAKNSITANDTATRILNLYKQPVAHFNCSTPLVGLGPELGDIVAVTHRDGPNGGFDTRPFELIEIIFDPNNFMVSLRGKDVTQISGHIYFLGDEDAWRIADSGTVQVSNGSDVVTFSGAPDLTTLNLDVGDIFSIPSPTNEANRINVPITEITDATHLKVDNSVWVNESGMAYSMTKAYQNASESQQRWGHLCDEMSGEFTDGSPGFEFL